MSKLTGSLALTRAHLIISDQTNTLFRHKVINRMYRDRDNSPDYYPPPGPSSRRRHRSPASLNYPHPGGRGYHERRDSSPPGGHGSYRKRETSPDNWRSYSQDYKRPRSRSRSARSSSPSSDPKLSSFLASYKDDLKSLHCTQCEIHFNDRDR